MKKFISSLAVVLTFAQIVCVSAFAEDVNTFPPQRPEVGNMKVATSDNLENLVVGLRTNGTVNLIDRQREIWSISEESKNELLSLTNIVDVDCTNGDVAALKSDGTVFTTSSGSGISIFEEYKKRYKEADSWTDIVAIACGNDHLVGLKSDGTVVATGDNDNGECNVSGWNNVSKIYAIQNTTLAIRKDGTILATGEIENYSEIRKVKNAKDIFQYANLDKFIVLLEDGKTTTDMEDIPTAFKEMGYSQKIQKMFVNNEAFGIDYYILDELGDLYLYDSKYSTIKKVEENIEYFTSGSMNYYAVDENGQILSNSMAFTSDDWILTTNITYNGNKINSNVPPYVKDGRTLAPIRAILEALGMTVAWDGTTQTATAVKADITISVTINSNIAVVNGVQKTLDVPAEITNGRTFVPVRFFAEALNMNVDWDGYTKTVIIEAK